MKEALFYEAGKELKVRCTLCPHRCSILPGRTGTCGVRKNEDGRLIPLTYRLFSSIHVDPIEKKPLYHFYPGRNILSLGSYGCNLDCLFCQNHEISQCPAERFTEGTAYDPAELVQMAAGVPDNIGIAYTYNEPLISIETLLETGTKVHEAGMKNIMVTNGYINPEPLEFLLPVMDAWNIDLKAFTDEFYRRITSSRLEPVKETLKAVRRYGAHLEVTNLVIPGYNDDPEHFLDMVKWIAEELGRDTPLHLSRYFPRHRLNAPPTPEHTLMELYETATVHLDYVFVGNMQVYEGQSTICPNCHTLLIRRLGYRTEIRGLAPDGTCSHCSTLVIRHHG